MEAEAGRVLLSYKAQYFLSTEHANSAVAEKADTKRRGANLGVASPVRSGLNCGRVDSRCRDPVGQGCRGGRRHCNLGGIRSHDCHVRGRGLDLNCPGRTRGTDTRDGWRRNLIDLRLGRSASNVLVARPNHASRRCGLGRRGAACCCRDHTSGPRGTRRDRCLRCR